MHISESQTSPNTILTKCSKMTEESHRRHGMNGNVDRTIKEECHKSNYGQGGRLKFFKDGKFILELERAREGERVSWVSVPRKTFWPPPGTASSTSVYRQESCTSLSVSDDNSSIQSSPWQRDHSWKQTTPRKGVSRELAMYFWRPRKLRVRARCGRKRRRPHSIAADYVENGAAGERTIKKERKEKRSLLAIVQGLIDKNFRTSTPPRSETVVSPRKRFLREMERDSRAQADESANAQKRSRCKPGPASTATPAGAGQSSGSSMSPPSAVGSPVRNGLKEEKPPPPQRNCSYSITSLLAEDRNVKRSPSNSPSQYSSVVVPARYCSPSSEDRWYSESVDRLRSIELSQAEKCGYPPYPPPQSYFGPYIYPFSPVPAAYYGAGGSYGRGYLMPSVYHAGPMSAVPVRHDAPSCSWNAAPSARDIPDAREDPIADMPLNLSKNSG